MNRKSDVVVVGSGIAGMSAALAAAGQGARTTLIARGVGALAISSGCIDVLGRLDGKSVENPFEAMAELGVSHPYFLAGGAEKVREALDWFTSVCRRHGLEMISHGGSNSRLVTVMGTRKPSYLYPASFDATVLDDADRACIITVEGMKDVHPKMISDELLRYPDMKGKSFFLAEIPCPVEHARRNITPVDIARFVERPGGVEWLRGRLAPYAKLYPVLILPPILGIESGSSIANRLSLELGTTLVETVAIPPAPGGLRLHGIMRRALNEAGVDIVENAEVRGADTEGTECRALLTGAPGAEIRWEAKSFVLATGGVLGGGILTEPGRAREAILGLPVPMPENIEDWSSPDIFGTSAFASMGVKADGQLRPADAGGKTLFTNVRIAGRLLGGYDFASEKSGNGVALATGRHAGMLAGKE